MAQKVSRRKSHVGEVLPDSGEIEWKGHRRVPLEDFEANDATIRGLRLFSLEDLEDIVLHPPMKRFVERWRPGDPAMYLGSLWIR